METRIIPLQPASKWAVMFWIIPIVMTPRVRFTPRRKRFATAWIITATESLTNTAIAGKLFVIAL